MYEDTEKFSVLWLYKVENNTSFNANMLKSALSFHFL
jgi:hypothetical protein